MPLISFDHVTDRISYASFPSAETSHFHFPSVMWFCTKIWRYAKKKDIHAH
jgi:hypothetical protein